MKDLWNQRYAEPGFKYGTAPNAFLRSQAHRLAPGSRLLLPGDGEGRNSVWLLGEGHDVWAVDYADVGLAKARQQAAALGQAAASRLHTVCADLTVWHPEPASMDAVIVTYLHLPEALRTAVNRSLARALRPGGLWIEEVFHPQQLRHDSGGPREATMLVDLAALRADLGAILVEVDAWEGEVVLDEGPGHRGTACVTRWVATRPLT